MQNIFTKPNAPYLTTGTLAAITLLASGVLAAAPYIGFLAPVAALNLGLPFIIGCALFSVVVVALSSYSFIEKNNEIKSKEDINAELKRKNSSLEKEISALNTENAALKEKNPAGEQIQVSGEEENSDLEAENVKLKGEKSELEKENAKFKQETNELADKIASETKSLQEALVHLKEGIESVGEDENKNTLKEEAKAFDIPLATLNTLNTAVIGLVAKYK